MDQTQVSELAPLLKAEQVARLLNVKTPTVYAWAQAGKLPSVRLGTAVRFDYQTVREVMQHGLKGGKNGS